MARRFRQKRRYGLLGFCHVNCKHDQTLILKLLRYRINRRRIVFAVWAPSRSELYEYDFTLDRISAEVFAVEGPGLELHPSIERSNA